ncbi:MAG: citrate/2-methylcitrate synthase [Oligoflexales bacterium]
MTALKAKNETVLGLENISVAESNLSFIDGLRGILGYKGRNIETIAFDQDFVSVCSLLWQGLTKTEDLHEGFGEARSLAFELMEKRPQILLREPMAAIRAGILAMADVSSELAPEILIVGSIPVWISGWYAMHTNLPALAPKPELAPVNDYLRMLFRAEADPALVRALETYLITVADHGMNASTFTARVIASTHSDMFSAVVGAIGALKGPLHGGAPGPVLDMLESIKTIENAEPWIRREVASGKRIMGMGHRIYRTRDPRAAIFERAIDLLSHSGISAEQLHFAREVEQACEKVLGELKPKIPIKANVEFYTAVLLDSIGLERSLFTPTFAFGRAVGWCAHIYEEKKYGRLIRPQLTYVGPQIF